MTTLAVLVAPADTNGATDAEFANRVSATERRVVSIAYGVLGNPHDAEEIAQEAFWRAYRRFASLRDPQKFRAWVSRIVYRLALNHLRARRRRLARDTAWYVSRPPGVHAGARVVLDRLFLDRVRREIEALPEKLRAVLLLCAIEGMEASEVAAILRIPVGTVRSRLHLARKRLLLQLTHVEE